LPKVNNPGMICPIVMSGVKIPRDWFYYSGHDSLVVAKRLISSLVW
jgi:hypothetical protein